MNDHPQAEACASNGPLLADLDQPAPERTWDALHKQVAQILPRLSTIGTSVVLLAPIIINGADSYGRGIRSC